MSSKGLKSNIRGLVFDASKILDVEEVERELFNSLSDSKGIIRDMCSHILNAGGKRVRPLLVLCSGMIYSEPSPELLKAAVSAELIHMASLVHDDIIDQADLRRKKPSINKQWGNHFAVLCGDYLFAKAFGILANHRLTRSMDYMVEAIQQMCYGEIVQARELFNYETDIETYYEKIIKKTAKLLECCCKSGAAVGGASDTHIEKIGEFGLNLGLAFQIIDDILDFCGDVDIMGKPRGEDIRQGNITLPLILLMRSGLYKDLVNSMNAENVPTIEEIDHIAQVLQESGVISEGYSIAKNHIEKAKNSLSALPDTRYTCSLYELTDMLQERMN